MQTADASLPNEKREEKPLCQTMSPAVTSASGNYDVQITMMPGDPPAVQVGENLHCEKCNSNFNSRDDLLQHQLSSHRRRRPKNGESVTDGVIIRGGKYECQFCHKTFDERHRYNGHVGSHMRNQVRNSAESRAAHVEEFLGTGSSDPLPHGNTIVQPAIGLESNVAAQNVRSGSDDPPNPCTDEQNGDSRDLNDYLGTVDNSMDVDVTKSKICLDSVTVLSNNENSNYCEASSGANVIKNAVDGVEKSCNAQERSSDACSPFSLDKPVDSDTNAITFVEPKISGSVSRSSNEQMESCDIDLDGGDFSRTMDEFRLEENKVVDDGTLFGLCDRNGGVNDSSAIGYKQHDQSPSNVGEANGKSISTAAGSEQKIFSAGTMLAPSSDGKEDGDRDRFGAFPSSTLEGGEHNQTGLCGSKGHQSDKHAQEERGIGSSRIVPTWNETGNGTGMFNKEVSVGIIEGHQQPKSSESNLPSLSGFNGSYGVEDYFNKVSTREVQQPKVNDVHNMRNNELVFSFSTGSGEIGTDATNKNKHEGGFEFRAFFPPENGKVFSAENNGMSVQNHAGEGSKKEPSGSVLLAQPRLAESSGEVYNVNKIFGTQVDEHRSNVIGNSKSHELCLAFSNQADSSGVELEKYGAKSFDIHSGINQSYGTQNNLNMGNVAPKEGRAFGIDLHGFSDKTSVFENNFNMVYPGRVWEEPKVDDGGNSGNKFMVGFGNSVPQPVEDVLAGSIWRTGEENLLRSDLTDPSTPLIQSSNGFHTFDIISDKVRSKILFFLW